MTERAPDPHAPGVTYQSHAEAPVAQLAQVDAGLDAHNQAFAPLADVRPLSVMAHAGALAGGAVGRTWGECAELQQLWVDPLLRGRGIGRELVRRFELAAAERGCTLVYLYTFDFQAPDFYGALGYTVDVETRGFTGGAVKYAMRKRLA